MLSWLSWCISWLNTSQNKISKLNSSSSRLNFITFFNSIINVNSNISIRGLNHSRNKFHTMINKTCSFYLNEHKNQSLFIIASISLEKRFVKNIFMNEYLIGFARFSTYYVQRE